MNKCVLLLGGNLGDITTNFQKSQKLLNNKGIKTIQASSLYQSKAWGFESNDLFLNQVIVCSTALNAKACLEITQCVEQKVGRKIKSTNLNYSSRLIDIDILFFNDELIETEELIVPHPRLHLRNFTLFPLMELMPEYIHPKLKKSIDWLCNHSKDKDLCQKIY